MNRFYQFTAWFLRYYFRFFYHFSVYGADSPLKGKAILASNHVSYYDPPFIAAAWPEEIHFLARAGLFKNKFWGAFLSKLNAHPVQENSLDIESIRLISRLLNEGKKVVIFPEGERTLTGNLQPIKSGTALLSIRTQSPIIPVYISGGFETWPRLKLFPRFRTSLTCVFGKPIYPNGTGSNGNGNGKKRKMQEEISLQIETSLNNLKRWVETGAQGEIPS